MRPVLCICQEGDDDPKYIAKYKCNGDPLRIILIKNEQKDDYPFYVRVNKCEWFDEHILRYLGVDTSGPEICIPSLYIGATRDMIGYSSLDIDSNHRVHLCIGKQTPDKIAFTPRYDWYWEETVPGWERWHDTYEHITEWDKRVHLRCDMIGREEYVLYPVDAIASIEKGSFECEGRQGQYGVVRLHLEAHLKPGATLYVFRCVKNYIWNDHDTKGFLMVKYQK